MWKQGHRVAVCSLAAGKGSLHSSMFVVMKQRAEMSWIHVQLKPTSSLGASVALFKSRLKQQVKKWKFPQIFCLTENKCVSVDQSFDIRARSLSAEHYSWIKHTHNILRLPWYLSWYRICLHCRRLQFDSWVKKIPWRRDKLPTPVFLGFPGDSDGKESACSMGHLASIPGLGRSRGGGHSNPLQYSRLENLHGQRSLVGYSPWGCKELDTTEWLSTAHNILTEI